MKGTQIGGRRTPSSEDNLELQGCAAQRALIGVEAAIAEFLPLGAWNVRWLLCQPEELQRVTLHCLPDPPALW